MVELQFLYIVQSFNTNYEVVLELCPFEQREIIKKMSQNRVTFPAHPFNVLYQHSKFEQDPFITVYVTDKRF